jgi:hypothetical protein
MKPAHFILCLCAALCSTFSIAQCLPAIPDTAACTGTEPLVVNNEVIGAGTTKYFYGSSATFTSLRIQSGGKLIVCGTLQVNDFGMQGGTLVITRSGRLTVNTGGGASLVFNGGTSIYNTGFFKVLTNLVLDGPDAWTNPAQPNIMWNGPGATFDMAFTYFVLEKGNCFFVNKGNAKLSGIITNTLSEPGSVCLGNMSRMQVMLLENKRQHTYVAPEGPACVFVSNWGFSVEQLTVWPSVHMCRGSSYCVGGCDSIARQNQKWGAATLMNTCVSCAGMFLLPAHFTDVAIKTHKDHVALSWNIEHMTLPSEFTIQRSSNGVDFQNIAAVSPRSQGPYTFTDPSPLSGRSFYRIVLNKELYSEVMTAFTSNTQPSPVVLPNPFKNDLTVLLPENAFVQEVRLLTPSGAIVQQQSIAKQNNRLHIRTGGSLKPGNYILQVITKTTTYNLKIVKQ